MQVLLLYALLSTAMFYLGSRAKITAPLWSRYPPAFAAFMDCPACTGFWWGVLIALYEATPMPLGLPPDGVGVVAAGLCTLVLTPIGAGIMRYGLDATGSAIDVE